jgi:hypothetical protein
MATGAAVSPSVICSARNCRSRACTIRRAVGLCDCGGPSLNDVVLESRATRHGRRQWLIEERHRKVAQIEQPCIDAIAHLKLLQNPLRGLF